MGNLGWEDHRYPFICTNSAFVEDAIGTFVIKLNSGIGFSRGWLYCEFQGYYIILPVIHSICIDSQE